MWLWIVGVGHFDGRKAGPGLGSLAERIATDGDAMRWASVLEINGGGDGGVWNALKQCRKLSRLGIVAMCGAGF